MESTRPGSTSRGAGSLPRYRKGAARFGAVTLAGALVAASALAHPGTAQADPDPSTGQLRSQAHKLADQLEQLTERYNGLRVKLQQSQRAAKVATDNAERQERALSGLREKVGSLAATSYMQGGSDPTAQFLSAQDPQAVLDQAATLRYFAAQDGTRVAGMLQAMQAAQRARKSAEDRAGQVGKLRKDLDAQRTKVTKLYDKVRTTLVKRDPTELARLPVIGNGKAAQALRYAMGKIGTPYVWGASGPSSFDCSGLIMWAYRQVGISLPHYTGAQYNAGTHVSRGQLMPGDLVFFYSDLHHVGLYIGGGKMLHAPQTGDVVKISSIEGRPFAGAVRVA